MLLQFRNYPLQLNVSLLISVSLVFIGEREQDYYFGIAAMPVQSAKGAKVDTVFVLLLSCRMLLFLVVIIEEFHFQKMQNLILPDSLLSAHSYFFRAFTTYPCILDLSVYAQTRLPFNVANFVGCPCRHPRVGFGVKLSLT